VVITILYLSGFTMKLKRLGLSLVTICVVVGGSLSTSGCSSAAKPSGEKELIPDGSILISRPLPKVITGDTGVALGLIPSPQKPAGTWLSIDTAHKTVTLMEGEKVSLSATGEGINALKPGKYVLLHKQRNPLWYAPSSYFAARKLAVPAEGDKARFRRGALGDFVLYIDKEVPIHSGPIWLTDIGGVKLDDTSLSKMYYLLNVGAEVEVK
jgi:hypothetical protein